MSLIQKIIKDIDFNNLNNLQDILNFNISKLCETDFIEFCNLLYYKKYTTDIVDNDLMDFSLNIIKNNSNLIRIFSFNLNLLLIYLQNKYPLTDIQKADIELLEEDEYTTTCTPHDSTTNTNDEINEKNNLWNNINFLLNSY
jgi:hypothetical protein